MSEWDDKRKKDVEDNLKLIEELPLKEAIEHALDLRSDDFGHSYSTLLECESSALHIIGERALTKIAELEKEISKLKEAWPVDRDRG